MKHNPYRKGRMAEMNVVPYIDVMLVLLIIFMITSPLLVEGIKVDLPQASQSTPDVVTDEGELIVVSIDADGLLYLQDNEQPYSEPDMVAALKELLEEKHSRILLKGDKNVAYGRIMQVIDTLKTSGVTNVALITSIKTEQSP
ncbi:protein TolR [Candidatus Albibeggiatoa sp. nov. NOAA]|uniref:protein TolR n=1 Tax=Candidatus Albibeggiatoa sp. nov. NOAA TaxID=3162724 RepID=UPI0033041A00|nr:protein TolR [Thiotrichaceae bacterium]